MTLAPYWLIATGWNMFQMPVQMGGRLSPSMGQ